MALRLATVSLALTITTLMMTGSTHATAMEECYEKYKAAKKAGTLKGRMWMDYKKAECGSAESATPGSAPGGAKRKTTAPKAEKKEATRPAAPPAAAPNGSPSGAWTTEASSCNKIFVKSGGRISFAKDSELIGGGLIIQGGEVQGTGATCRIKTMKEEGELTHMLLGCSTTIMHFNEQFSIRRVNADEIFRLFPNMEGMETKYFRCPM